MLDQYSQPLPHSPSVQPHPSQIAPLLAMPCQALASRKSNKLCQACSRVVMEIANKIAIWSYETACDLVLQELLDGVDLWEERLLLCRR